MLATLFTAILDRSVGYVGSLGRLERSGGRGVTTRRRAGRRGPSARSEYWLSEGSMAPAVMTVDTCCLDSDQYCVEKGRAIGWNTRSDQPGEAIQRV